MLKMLLLDPAGVPQREPGTLFIVCRVLIAFLLKSNLPMWGESPTKAQLVQQFPSLGFYSEGGTEKVHSDVCVRMLTTESLKHNKDQVTQKRRSNLYIFISKSFWLTCCAIKNARGCGCYRHGGNQLHNTNTADPIV